MTRKRRKPAPTLVEPALPPAFRNALGKGPVTEVGLPTFNRNSQLETARRDGKTAFDRTMNQMGGKYGFRGKED